MHVMAADPPSPRNGRHSPVLHAASQAAGDGKVRLMKGATRAIRSGVIGGSFASSITIPRCGGGAGFFGTMRASMTGSDASLWYTRLNSAVVSLIRSSAASHAQLQ